MDCLMPFTGTGMSWKMRTLGRTIQQYIGAENVHFAIETTIGAHMSQLGRGCLESSAYKDSVRKMRVLLLSSWLQKKKKKMMPPTTRSSHYTGKEWVVPL